MTVAPVHEMATFSLDGLQRGTRSNIWLTAEAGADDPVQLAVLAARGRESEKTLVVITGVHGNEYEGMEAVRRVFADLDPAAMHGDFLAVVVANPWAYATCERTTPRAIDGLNLARVFPGVPQGSPTERLAAGLLDLVESHVGQNDLFVDLHSGTAEVAFATMVGFRDIRNDARTVSEEAARHMGLPLLWAIPDSKGPLNAETARRGIPTIGTETTGRAGCREADVQAYTSGLWNLLAYLDIVQDRPRPVRESLPARATVDVLAPLSGFARVMKRIGDRVTEADLLASIINEFGEIVGDVRSAESGQIWAALESPLVKSGDLMFMIALEP